MSLKEVSDSILKYGGPEGMRDDIGSKMGVLNLMNIYLSFELSVRIFRMNLNST